jgi:hypothetical protein
MAVNASSKCSSVAGTGSVQDRRGWVGARHEMADMGKGTK